MRAMRLLLAEDDPVLGRALEMGLNQDGLLVDWMRNGSDAFARFTDGVYDALVVDVGLPGMDGFEMLHRIRQIDCHVAVLIVTARGAVEDRIRGLEFGADDYLTKPFELDELLARLRAVERRVRRQPVPALRVGAVVVDVMRHIVTVSREQIELDAREFSLLRLMMDTPDEVSRFRISRHLESLGDLVDGLTVDQYIDSLNEKLGLDFVQSRRGWRRRAH
jgi:two-component system response regulator QseB